MEIVKTSEALCKHGLPVDLGCPTCIADEQREKAAAESRRKWEEQQKAEQTRRSAAFGKVYAGIGAEVVAKGHKWSFTEGRSVLVDGINVGYYLDLSFERSHISSWRSTETNKVRVTVGDYGNRRTFPQRKDGTHNYADIADTLIGYAERQNTKEALAAQRKRNESPVEKFNKAHDSKYGSYGPMQVDASSDYDKPLFVEVNIQRSMTVEEAEKLLEALTALGLC